MKINEIISKERIMEYENFSDLASQALNDPNEDEMGKQTNTNKMKSRKPLITLKHIHKLKLVQVAKRQEMEQRRLLMGLMYAVSSNEESI